MQRADDDACLIADGKANLAPRAFGSVHQLMSKLLLVVASEKVFSRNFDNVSEPSRHVQNVRRGNDNVAASSAFPLQNASQLLRLTPIRKRGLHDISPSSRTVRAERDLFDQRIDDPPFPPLPVSFPRLGR